jgi:small-conductance mechanosensitive channel
VTVANGLANGSLLTGVQRVFEAGERLLVNHAELVRLESREQIASVVTRFGLMALGAVFLLSAWLGLLVTAIVALDALPLATRIGAATALQGLIGGALLLAARRAKEEPGDAS